MNPLKFIQALVPTNQPLMSRPSYAAEILTSLTFPIVVGLTEGSVIGILAKRVFDVGPILFAVIMASGVLSNITSFIWARAARGRGKVKVITLLMTLALCSVASISLLPASPRGGLLLTLLVLLIRALLAGVVTLRSIVWRQNYRRRNRASITGRLALCASLVAGIAPLLGYFLLDYHVEAFRILYPLAAVYALIGVWSFRRIRIRGEKKLLEFEKSPGAEPVVHGVSVKVYEYNPVDGRPSFFTVLKKDVLYRRYMIAQFVQGTANVTALTIFVFCVEEVTRSMPRSFFMSILLTAGIPFFLTTLTLPAWARLLDRVHIASFYSAQIWMYIAYQVLAWAGLYFGTWIPVLLASVFIGLGRGGALIAWELGHNDFTNPRMVSLYMGIHATLTGVRGATAPFIGILLYSGWASRSLFGFTLPGIQGIGESVFLLSVAGNLLALLLFSRLAQDVKK